MIFFPTIYEDELLYSAIARYHNRSANITIRDTYRDVFNREHITPIVYFPSHIENMIENMPFGCNYTVEEIINKHTLYPFFTSFIDEELSTKIFNLMKGSSSNIIPRVLGTQMMSINKSKFFKFCPICMEDDIDKYGEYYWHRLHQVPGVLVCHKHKVQLENSTVYISSDKPLLVLPSKYNCISNTSTDSIYNEETIDVLYKLAKDIEKMFSLSILKRDKLWYRENYVNYIISKDLATFNGRIKSKELIKRFKDYYGDFILDILDSNIEFDDYYNWLYKIFKTNNNVNPIRHLLLINFLDVDIEDIFEIKYRYMPFGKPLWPCLNKVCKNYKKNVIENVSLNYNYIPNKILIGTFECSCGFIYTRQASDLDRYKPSRIKKYGTVWESKLIELLKNSNKSMSEIAKELNTTSMTISRYCKKIKLLQNKSYENINKKKQKTNNKKITQKKHRNTWKKLLKENPNISRSDLIILSKSAHCWLYKFDKEWLENNMPESKRYKHQITRKIDWDIRDKEMLTTVKLIVERMFLSSGKPERISVSSIASKMEKPFMLKANINKMKNTKLYIESVRDTTKSFRIKKIKWAIKEMYENKEKISISKVTKKISLDPNAINELRNIINEEIERVKSIQ